MPNKICVVLGAGASHDVKNAGSPSGAISRDSGIVGRPELKPPLAKDLFNIESNEAYWDYLREYKGAQVLTQGLAQQSLRDGFDLEAELRRLAYHQTSLVIKQHYRHIPPYLRDLIAACSYEYTPVPSCYVALAQILLEEAPSDVLFLTLNYDDLLEQALNLLVPKTFTFDSLDDYIRPERPAKVVKLHGSTTPQSPKTAELSTLGATQRVRLHWTPRYSPLRMCQSSVTRSLSVGVDGAPATTPSDPRNGCDT